MAAEGGLLEEPGDELVVLDDEDVFLLERALTTAQFDLVVVRHGLVIVGVVLLLGHCCCLRTPRVLWAGCLALWVGAAGRTRAQAAVGRSTRVPPTPISYRPLSGTPTASLRPLLAPSLANLCSPLYTKMRRAPNTSTHHHIHNII